MPVLNTNLDGVPKQVEFSVKLCKGIYYVDNSRQANINCKTFAIDYDKGTDTMVTHKLTKVKTLCILTLSGAGEQRQYLVFNTASAEDIDEYLERFPEELLALIKRSDLSL